jgi:nucleosome binding factor SPN SPT16 subunit
LESKMKFGSPLLTFIRAVATIAHNDVRSFFESHQLSQEEGMKQSHVPLKMDAEQPKSLLRKLSLLEEKNKPKSRGSRQQKLVQKVTAGHVRGGHSFH